MKFAISIEVSIGVEKQTHLIRDLSNKLSLHFLNKDYGNDVIEIIIGIISVAPEFEWFSTVRKPRYKFFRRHFREGTEIIEDRIFVFDLKIDYESFKNQTDYENERMLASEIFGSLSNLDRLPKKIKYFDKVRFREDMRNFLVELNLLCVE